MESHFSLAWVMALVLVKALFIVANPQVLRVRFTHFWLISRLPHAWFSFSRETQAWLFTSEKKIKELIPSDFTCLSNFTSLCPRIVNWTPCCLISSNYHPLTFRLKAKIHCAICVSSDYFKKLEHNEYLLVWLYISYNGMNRQGYTVKYISWNKYLMVFYETQINVMKHIDIS